MGKAEEALNTYEKMAEDSSASELDKAYAYEQAGRIILAHENKTKGRNALKMAEKIYREAGNLEKANLIKGKYYCEEMKIPD